MKEHKLEYILFIPDNECGLTESELKDEDTVKSKKIESIKKYIENVKLDPTYAGDIEIRQFQFY